MSAAISTIHFWLAIILIPSQHNHTYSSLPHKSFPWKKCSANWRVQYKQNVLEHSLFYVCPTKNHNQMLLKEGNILWGAIKCYIRNVNAVKSLNKVRSVPQKNTRKKYETFHFIAFEFGSPGDTSEKVASIILYKPGISVHVHLWFILYFTQSSKLTYILIYLNIT